MHAVFLHRGNWFLQKNCYFLPIQGPPIYTLLFKNTPKTVLDKGTVTPFTTLKDLCTLLKVRLSQKAVLDLGDVCAVFVSSAQNITFYKCTRVISLGMYKHIKKN